MALITAGAGGIGGAGGAEDRALAQEGVRVVINDLEEDGSQATAAATLRGAEFDPGADYINRAPLLIP
jgi:NAD(P)-dependent dehydrogenase (short-subunit alcohol dehydrogenase family)